MGYQIYKVGGNRWGGYGVPAICEQPECDKEIDRGMGCACGDAPGSELGCDRYFCGEHLFYCQKNTGFGKREIVTLCARCRDYKVPFPYKPETKKWVEHLLNDDSWAEWRKKNRKEVNNLKDLL